MIRLSIIIIHFVLQIDLDIFLPNLLSRYECYECSISACQVLSCVLHIYFSSHFFLLLNLSDLFNCFLLLILLLFFILWLLIFSLLWSLKYIFCLKLILISKLRSFNWKIDSLNLKIFLRLWRIALDHFYIILILILIRLLQRSSSVISHFDWFLGPWCLVRFCDINSWCFMYLLWAVTHSALKTHVFFVIDLCLSLDPRIKHFFLLMIVWIHRHLRHILTIWSKSKSIFDPSLRV